MAVFSVFFCLLACAPTGGLRLPACLFAGLIPWLMSGQIPTEESTSVAVRFTGKPDEAVSFYESEVLHAPSST